MGKLGENPGATPILDNLLAGFTARYTGIPTCQREDVENIKMALGLKAKSGTLTVDDIENALNQVPNMGRDFTEDLQKGILRYLALNYPMIFIELTGHNPF